MFYFIILINLILGPPFINMRFFVGEKTLSQTMGMAASTTTTMWGTHEYLCIGLSKPLPAIDFRFIDLHRSNWVRLLYGGSKKILYVKLLNVWAVYDQFIIFYLDKPHLDQSGSHKAVPTPTPKNKPKLMGLQVGPARLSAWEPMETIHSIAWPFYKWALLRSLTNFSWAEALEGYGLSL